MTNIYPSGNRLATNLQGAGGPYGGTPMRKASHISLGEIDSDSDFYCDSDSDSYFDCDSEISIESSVDIIGLQSSSAVLDTANSIHNDIVAIFNCLIHFSDDFLGAIRDTKNLIKDLQRAGDVDLEFKGAEIKEKDQCTINSKLQSCFENIGLSIGQKVYRKRLRLKSGNQNFVDEMRRYVEARDFSDSCFYYDELSKNGLSKSYLDDFIFCANIDAENLTNIEKMLYKEIDKGKKEFEMNFLSEPSTPIIGIMAEAIFGFCLTMGGFIALMNPIISSAISITLFLSGILLFLLRIRSGINVLLYRKDRERKKLAEKEFEEIRGRVEKIFNFLALSKADLKEIQAKKDACLRSFEIDKLGNMVNKLNSLISNSPSFRKQKKVRAHSILQLPAHTEHACKEAPDYFSPYPHPKEPLVRLGHSRTSTPVVQYGHQAASLGQRRGDERERFYAQFMPLEYPHAAAHTYSQSHQQERLYSEEPALGAHSSNVQLLTQSANYSTQRVDQEGAANWQEAEQSGLSNEQHVQQKGSRNRQEVKQIALYGAQQWVRQEGTGNQQYVTQIHSFGQQNMDQSGVSRAHQTFQTMISGPQQPGVRRMAPLGSPVQISENQLKKDSPPLTPPVGQFSRSTLV